MTQLTIYFFLNNFLCVFDKCGLLTLSLAIFSNSVSGVLLEGRGWEVEGRKIIYKKSRVIYKKYKKSGVVFLKYFMVFIVKGRNLRPK
jgi:hypothetical protein